jgi:hypothetical protein
METEAETDDQTISLEDTLSSLKRNAKAVDVYFHESRKSLKEFQKKLNEESKSLATIPLQPRTRCMKWLTDRHLPVESSFSEFFEAFVEEHAKDQRLDLSKRSIILNESACILFGYKQKDHVVTIWELLEKLPHLYL